jgi:phospholipid/cholesterol/gamma-HCH transport system permease protein
LHSDGGTRGVGRTTTDVVVMSSIFIMVADFFLTKLFIITVYPKY